MAAAAGPQAPQMVRHIEQGETVFSAAELHVVRLTSMNLKSYTPISLQHRGAGSGGK